MSLEKHSHIYFPDIRIFGIAIPLISAFNYYLTYSNIKLNGFLLLTFTIDTLQGYMAWWAVRAIILRLDTKLPFENVFLKRIGIQLFLTTVAGMGIIIALTEMVSWIARGRSAHISFYSVDIFIIFIWFLVINGVYIGLWFYRQWQKAEAEKKAMVMVQQGGIRLKSGNSTLLVKFDEIAACFVEGEYVKLIHISGKGYYTEWSLNRLEEQLPSMLFFRINRQCMVHRQIVAGFKRLENGKLELACKTGFSIPVETTISRTKAGAFKGWFLPE